MAGSRLEKIGTIYSRTTGLIRTGALAWEDRPLWYDIYEAFPPKEEPCYDRPAPNLKVKHIFYEEDKIRAIFHRNNKKIGTSNLQSDRKTLTHYFIDTYKKLQQQYTEPVSEEQLYKETIDILNKERESRKVVEEPGEAEDVQLSNLFKESRASQAEDKKPVFKVNVSDLFKD